LKILLLADISSEHTQKWALGLASSGISVGIFSLNRAQFDWFSAHPNIKILDLGEEKLDGRSFLEKINYITTIRRVRKAIAEFKPDILHAHYASSYGLLGALSRFHPYLISVWGADVFDFPKQSPLHKKIFKFNLKKADRILSTSYIMKEETKKYTSKKIDVTPFGVDVIIFHGGKAQCEFSAGDIIVGSVKSLEKKYGTDVLLTAFSIATKKKPDLNLKLLLVGSGSQDAKLKQLAIDLGINEKVKFAGKVPHDRIADYHRTIDIFVSVSVDDSESFGVSAVEACACEKAVIVARTGGLKEVIVENETGFVVEPNNPEETASAIIRFAEDGELRKEFGLRARKRVLAEYNWNENLKKMISIYGEVVKGEKAE
jgi:L-malate glycosyltransferase